MKPTSAIRTNILTPAGPYVYRPCPTATPWGRCQETDILMWGLEADGTRVPVLWQVHTAGHGGTRLHAHLASHFLQGIPEQCYAFGGSRLWYEEDCESAVPLFIFYNGLTPSCWLLSGDKSYPRSKLFESIQRWMPDACEAVLHLAEKFDDALLRQGTPLRSGVRTSEPTGVATLLS